MLFDFNSRSHQEYETFMMLLQHIPGFRKEIISLYEHPAEFRRLNMKVL